MDEYILPVKYQNVGCGISVVVAGLEQNYQNYKEIKISIDGENYIQTNINPSNKDFSNIVSFDNLIENQFYIIYAQLILNDNNIINMSAKVVPQIGTITVELPNELKKERCNGGSLLYNVKPIIKEVI